MKQHDTSRRRFVISTGLLYDAKWGTGFVNGEFFTKLVYNGVG